MSEHREAPWHFDDHYSVRDKFNTIIANVQAAEFTYDSADILTRKSTPRKSFDVEAELVANAHLIAAAPLLLAALEAVEWTPVEAFGSYCQACGMVRYDDEDEGIHGDNCTTDAALTLGRGEAR